MCRRFLADSADFSEEKLAAAGIRDRFENTDLTKCLKDITKYLKRSRNIAEILITEKEKCRNIAGKQRKRGGRMEMRVNQIQQPAPVEQVQNTAPTDGSFKFMLASHVEEAELQERLTNLMAEITTEGEKAGQETGCEGYATLPWAGQGISQ